MGDQYLSCDDALLIEARQLVFEWAKTRPLINRVWFFGSRIRNEHRPNSDLDVAIEIDKLAIRGVDRTEGCHATWMHERDGWQKELCDLLGLTVDLRYYSEGDSKIPVMRAALERSSMFVYQKYCSEN